MANSEDPFDDRDDRPVYSSRRFGRRQDRNGSRRTAVLLLVGALVVGGLGWLAWTRIGSGDGPAPAADRAAATDTLAAGDRPAQGGAVGDTTTEPLPPLDESDPVVRRLAEGISNRPRVASWFVPEDLVRRFVVAVTNVANGRSPEEQVDFMEVEGDFQVRSEEGRMVVDPASYRRYDGLVAAFVSLDPDHSASLYGRLRPLFDEAYRELGLGGEGFDPVLARAVGNLLAVRLPAPPVEVQPQEAVYGYVDPELEARTPAEKHLMRMGPDNARRVQDKLRELAGALGLEVPGDGAGG
jgi:hypothetical protein